MIKSFDRVFGEDVLMVTQWGGRKALEALAYASEMSADGATAAAKRECLLWLFDALKGHTKKVIIATDSNGGEHRREIALDLDQHFAGRPAEIMPFVMWGLGVNTGTFTEGDQASPIDTLIQKVAPEQGSSKPPTG